MKNIDLVLIVLASICVLSTPCHAGCNCDDWMKKGGYCVDYIKTKIPSFPIPQSTAAITALKNKDLDDISEGDVAIFFLDKYWHVAYVEKVHLDQRGKSTAIDVSEMNFGDQMSFSEFKKKWRKKSRGEWKRAMCCGVTDTYDQLTSRQYVSLNTVKQVWSPTVTDDDEDQDDDTVFEKVREVLNRFIQFTGREL